MSKAFTRESDDLPDPSPLQRFSSLLPLGVKNYMTEVCAQRIREELARLTEVERPALPAPTTKEGTSLERQSLDLRIAQLERSLATAVIVPRPPPGEDRVRFGATVKVRNQSGDETLYRIVGLDEVDFDRGWVSWMSPIAKALLNHRPGDLVRFRTPDREEELRVRDVSYD